MAHVKEIVACESHTWDVPRNPYIVGSQFLGSCYLFTHPCNI